ncbi:MAG: hypothetical protein K6G85_00175 [Eubacterium sp.]|nr:hypothetical protein [Eubacterium sp.]
MKVEELNNKIQKMRNIDDYEEIYRHIWEVDADIWDKLISKSELNIERPSRYTVGQSENAELLANEKYIEMYVYYVLAKDDMLYQDTESYSNNMILYNNLMNEFSAEFRENHRSNNKYRIKY